MYVLVHVRNGRSQPSQVLTNPFSMVSPEWAFSNLYAPHARLGDTFLVVSFEQISVVTCDADVVTQITSRREQFPKPLEQYRVLELFGPNVVTTEGRLWRMHRRVTAASFNETNAAYTFVEAINQAQSMLAKWLPDDAAMATGTMRTLEGDTMTLAFNIIAYVGFGLRFLWPHQQLPADADPRLVKYGNPRPDASAGYTMNFVVAAGAVLQHIVLLLLLPWRLLNYLPFEGCKQAYEGKENFVKYMQAFLQDKVDEVRNGEREKAGMDFMGHLVRARYGETKDAAWMTDSDMIGNAFLLFLAGHETTGNVLHFTLLEMAINPACQRKLQRDVDRLFGASDPRTWAFEQHINAMLASHLGACMNETLRLMPPVAEVPKMVSPTADQSITIDGVEHVLPAGMHILLNIVGAGRNPRYWPGRPSATTGATTGASTDVDDYVPMRWFRHTKEHDGQQQQRQGKGQGEGEGEGEDLGEFRGPDTSPALFRPVRGSFIVFGDGARSCLGRRIAQVEILAALAVVFQQCSIELAVDEWATDREVEAMDGEARAAVYARAQDKARATLRQATTLLTLKLNGGKHVPVRVVKRGHERFVRMVDT